MTDADLEFSHQPSRPGESGETYLAEHDGVVVSRILGSLDDGVLTIASTLTDPRHRGAGHAGRLTRFALDDARRRGVRVVPRCPYTADWIERHPDYADVLA